MHSRGADTCTDCLKILLRFRSLSSLCISCEEIFPNEERIESDIGTFIAQSSETQKEAEDHICKYKTQRELKNSIQSIARDDVSKKVPFKQRTHCLTIDMG